MSYCKLCIYTHRVYKFKIYNMTVIWHDRFMFYKPLCRFGLIRTCSLFPRNQSHHAIVLVVVFQSAVGPGVTRPVPRDVTPSRTCLSGNGATSPRSVSASSVPWGTAGSRCVRHNSWCISLNNVHNYFLHPIILSHCTPIHQWFHSCCIALSD